MQLIVFDFDGTLVDSQGAIWRGMKEAFGALGLAGPERQAVRRVVGLRLEDAIARLAESQDEALVARLSERYRKAFFAMRQSPDFHEPLFPGVREALARLDRPEVFLAIATGKNRRGLVWSLDHHGLDHHFSILKTADDGPSKPHPEILRQAMDEAAAVPEETVVIGDTAFDMAMARNAGAKGLGVAWGYHDDKDLLDAGAETVVQSFDDLLQQLQDLGMIKP